MKTVHDLQPLAERRTSRVEECEGMRTRAEEGTSVTQRVLVVLLGNDYQDQQRE
jgi:hypothetical protein